MDLWNNEIGREVAYEMKYKLGDDFDLFGYEWINERAKKMIWQKMQQGELITNPFLDRRKYANIELERLKEDDKIDTVIDFKKFDEKKRILRAKRYIEQIVDSDWEIPTIENLNKRVQIGELIYVENYTRVDGTKVHGYCRRRPYYIRKRENI